VASTGPDLNELVACGHHLADSRGLARADDRALRAKLVEVLARKHFVEAAREGFITRQEARDAVLGHIWTFVCHASGTSLSIGWQDDPTLSRRVERALFGDS